MGRDGALRFRTVQIVRFASLDLHLHGGVGDVRAAFDGAHDLPHDLLSLSNALLSPAVWQLQ